MTALLTPTTEPNPQDTVAAAARRALEKCDGDVARAIAVMAADVRRSPKLRTALLDPLIEYACNNAVRQQVSQQRRSVWTAPKPNNNNNNNNMTPLQRGLALAASNLMMFPLPYGGKKLGEATRDEVAKNAEFYELQATDMSHKGRWLRLIAQSVTGSKTVAQCLSDERLRELQGAASNA